MSIRANLRLSFFVLRFRVFISKLSLMSIESLQTDLSFKTEINLYYDLYVPENLQKSAPLLVAVHGYGAHKRYMMREARLVADDKFVIASLQAPFQHFRPTADAGYKVGFGWLTDFRPEESIAIHQNFVLKTIDALAANQTIDREKIFLFGFSQACALNFRFAFTNPNILRGVVGISGGIPSDLETNANYKPTGADVFYLYGDADEFYALEKFQTFERKLIDFLPKIQVKQFSAKHEITNEMRADIKNFLMENGKWKMENV